jgi:hypothetical protein
MMIDSRHSDCYGTLFPEAPGLRGDERLVGKVFGVKLTGPVGMFPQAKRVEFDGEQWEECVRCPEFERCYQLSLAKLNMQIAVQTS